MIRSSQLPLDSFLIHAAWISGLALTMLMMAVTFQSCCRPSRPATINLGRKQLTDTTSKFDQWAVLEIMGHQRYAGRVTEQSIGGQSFVRIDVPEIDEGRPAFTKLFGSGSIYCISPVTETVARLMCRQLRQKAISIFDLPKSFRDQLEHKPEAGNHDHEGCDDEEHF